ncbi:MAG: gamma-glutamyltransferase [Pseudomonadota bacterium]|nr:gamma-glutamyltransferase [Pseudomonadota bacterium]
MRMTRPVCRAENGMVSTAHYLASVQALDILKEGGTAVDAAICAASTLGVVLPHMIGIGGDAFWLIYNARSKKLSALNGSGYCGRHVNIEHYAGHQAIPARGPLSAITVAGAVDSWDLAYRDHGRLPLARLLEPAIHYARNGFPVSDDLSRWMAEDQKELNADPGASSLFLNHGHAYAPGSLLKQPALAQTLEHIAQQGPRYFYTHTSRSLASYLSSRGGLLSPDDFTDYHARWVNPISVPYRNCQVHQVPPPSQGIAGLMILNFLNGLDLSSYSDNSSAYYHALIQAVKWAFSKRDRHLGDPGFIDIPVSRLLDPLLSDSERSIWLNDSSQSHLNRPGGSDTSFICTADREGNVVGLVQSLYFDFGACMADPESGVLLQNRGHFFSLDPLHPNFLKPGKQSASTLMSAMAFKDGLPFMVYGTQGGEGQPQTQTSILTRVVDFGLDVQAAIEAPRVLYGRTWGDSASKLLIEDKAGNKVFEALSGEWGHNPEAVPWPYPRMGTAQAIRLKGPWSSSFEGGADPRGEGLALGY